MSQVLYDLPEGWEWKRLDELFEIARGGSPRPIKDFITTDDSGINWIKIGDTTVGGRYIYSTEEKIKPEGLKKSRLVVEGDFILSNSMSFGRPYIMKTKGCIHDGWLLLHPIYEQLDKEYVYYALSSPYVYKQFQNSAAGATVKNLNSDLVRQVQIPLPPLAEQIRIVEKLDAVLSRIDTAIDELQQSLELVDAMFKSGLDEAFNPLSSPINEIGLYDLPDGWEWKTVDELCTKITDGTHSTPTYTDSGVPFLSVKDITKGFIDFSNTKFISEEEHKNLFKRCNPEFDDILYTKVGTTGIAKVVDVNNDFSLFVSVALLKLRKEVIESKFFEYILNSPLCYSQACAKTRGVANRNLVLKDIKSICVVVPSLEAQQQLVEALDALNDKTTQLKTEITAKIGMFNQLKASVLDGAFRGEL